MSKDDFRWIIHSDGGHCEESARACIASLLGVTLYDIRDHSKGNWYHLTNKDCRRLGYELFPFSPYSCLTRCYWIAVVPSLHANNLDHCVIAKGARLVHDPSDSIRYTADLWNQTRHQKAIRGGWLLAPLDPIRNDGERE